MVSGIYSRFKSNLFNKVVDLEADTIKVALLSSNHSFSAANTAWNAALAANEVSGTGYDAGGTTLANAVSGRTWPKVVLLLELFNRYPEFNLDWILTGRGNMLIDADQTVNSQSFSNKNTMPQSHKIRR